LRDRYAPERLDADIENLIAKLDKIVGPALGLTSADMRNNTVPRIVISMEPTGTL